MPSEDVFFDEPFHTGDPGQFHQAQTASRCAEQTTVEHINTDLLVKLVETALRQEALLERVVREVEKLNTRLLTIELNSGSRPHCAADSSPRGEIKDKSISSSKSTIPRGSLLLPPGSRPVLPNFGTRIDASSLGKMEDIAERDRKEQEAIARLRKEEEERLAHMEAERKRIEEEEERARLEHVKRIEEERRHRQEVEKRTKELLNNLIVSDGTRSKGLFDSDNEDNGLDGSSGPNKQSNGLFDD